MDVPADVEVCNQKTPATHSNQRHRCGTDFHAIHAVGDHLPYDLHTARGESRVKTVEQVHLTKGYKPRSKANVGGREHRRRQKRAPCWSAHSLHSTDQCAAARW